MEGTRKKLFLLGHAETQIIGAKLPSNGQVLRVLFHNLRNVKLSVRGSAHLVIQEVQVFWQKAKIPMRVFKNCIQKLESLYKEWESLHKSCKRRNKIQEDREKEFVDKLEDLFDIAHADALEMIHIEEDKLFLLSQRQRGRPGSMIGADRALYRKELKKVLRQEQEESRAKQSTLAQYKADSVPGETIEMSSSSPEDVLSQDDNIEFVIPMDEPGPSNPKKRRGRKEFITSKLVTTLDKCKVSDRDAVRIITATAQALNHDLDDLVINRSSIRRQRMRVRAELAEKYRVAFKNRELGSVTLHWDGKLLPALVGKEKIDRLPVLITFNGTEQLLGIPVLVSGSGKDQASAVHNLVKEWDLDEKVQALCCDTTSSNMGRFQGTCVRLEQLFERELIYFPCRHHIYEIILRSIFDEKLEKSSGPNIPIFKNFQAVWSQINKSNFIAGIKDEYVHQSIDNIAELLQFARQTLKNEKQPREDYREFIELVIVFLGGNCDKNYVFRAPGAFHHARWMAKGIYCLKIYLFRKEFTLTSKEATGIRDICIFLANLYLKAWIRAPVAREAPRQDLEFLQNLYAYRQDETISRTALNKIINHLWYLAPETAALSFFDSAIPHEIKVQMVEAINVSEESDDKESMKKFTICPDDIQKYIDKKIHHFISPHSKRLFEKFSIPTTFLEKDPSTWNNDPDFKFGMTIVQGLKVVNDTAERGVKLMEDYNKVLTRNEEEKQYILQTVMEYRKQYPDATKQNLSQSF